MRPATCTNDSQRQPGARLDILQVGADNFDFAVFDSIHVGNLHQLEAGGLAATALQVDIFLANTLAFEGRTVGTGMGISVIVTFRPRTSMDLAVI